MDWGNVKESNKGGEKSLSLVLNGGETTTLLIWFPARFVGPKHGVRPQVRGGQSTIHNGSSFPSSFIFIFSI